MKQYTITYLGGPTVLIEIGGLRFMTDPTLDPAGTVFGSGTAVSYSKLKGPAFSDIGKIDVVLLSHDQHGDNLDNAGRALLSKVAKTLTTQVGATRLGGNAVGLAPWEFVEFRSAAGDLIRITATPARHGPEGSEKITGDVIGFVLTVKGLEGFELYFTGDTVYYDGIKEVANRFHPQNVFIFAGAAKPRGPFNVTMGANDALDTAAAFPDATITPLHFEGWTHYTEGGAVLRESFAALGIGERLHILEAGVATELPIWKLAIRERPIW